MNRPLGGNGHAGHPVHILAIGLGAERRQPHWVAHKLGDLRVPDQLHLFGDDTSLLHDLFPNRSTVSVVDSFPGNLAEMLTADEIAQRRANTREHGVSLSETDWQLLWQLTRKALSESSEASRLSGAGASLVDID